MNKILSMITDQACQTYQAETEVYKISRRIQSIIGLHEIPSHDVSIPMVKYRIIKTHRRFSNGWHFLLEIVPVEIQEAPGVGTIEDPGWPVHRHGTSAINLPPTEIINEFFKELDDFLKVKMTKHEAIRHIESLYPPDARDYDTMMIGKVLMDDTVGNPVGYNNWRDLPEDSLIKLAIANLEEAGEDTSKYV